MNNYWQTIFTHRPIEYFKAQTYIEPPPHPVQSHVHGAEEFKWGRSANVLSFVRWFVRARTAGYLIQHACVFYVLYGILIAVGWRWKGKGKPLRRRWLTSNGPLRHCFGAHKQQPTDHSFVVRTNGSVICLIIDCALILYLECQYLLLVIMWVFNRVKMWRASLLTYWPIYLNVDIMSKLTVF